MRKLVLAIAGVSTVLMLAGCGGGGRGVFNRGRPDEFAVTRAAPLVVPPDFALAPPRPGAPRPQEADSSTQALQAMFGGQRQGSAGESAVTGAAGTPQAGIRSEAGDPATGVVNKGAVTRDIINAPEGDGAEATVSTPQ